MLWKGKLSDKSSRFNTLLQTLSCWTVIIHGGQLQMPRRSVNQSFSMTELQSFVQSRDTQEFLSYFPSYADDLCSGKGSCEIPTRDLIVHFKPCPLELSAYLEASHSCVPGKNLTTRFMFFYVLAKFCRQDVFWKINVYDSGPWINSKF